MELTDKELNRRGKMKKYRVIARAEIIDPITGKLHTDEGLMALDGYREFIVEAENELDIETLNRAIEKFEIENVNKSRWHYTIDGELHQDNTTI